jgi:hypothetical protein
MPRFPLPKKSKENDTWTDPYIVIAPEAGTTDRCIPADIVDNITRRIENLKSWAITRRRHILVDAYILDPERYSVPESLGIIQRSLGIVCAHSAMSMFAAYNNIPQLLLYPDYVLEKHIWKRDQWSWYVDNDQVFHATFDNAMSEFAKFKRSLPVFESIVATSVFDNAKKNQSPAGD